MRLTRNTTNDGKCKYAIVRLDKLREMEAKLETRPFAPVPGDLNDARVALDLLGKVGLIEYGEPGTQEEFFVLKLKDENAASALEAYAESADFSDEELGDEVFELSERSRNHPARKRPD